MSAIASFYVVNGRDMPEVQKAARGDAGDGLVQRLGRRGGTADDFSSALSRYGRERPVNYRWSGYCFLYLLTYLEDMGVPLLQSEYDQQTQPAFADLSGVSVIPLTPQHKIYLPRLDPGHLDADEVQQYFAENYGIEDIGAEASRDGLVVLSGLLAALGDDEVLLLVVG